MLPPFNRRMLGLVRRTHHWYQPDLEHSKWPDTPAAAAAQCYEDATVTADPNVYYRLGELNDTTAVDRMGAHNGTYDDNPGSPTLGRGGALSADLDTAVQMGGGGNVVLQPNAAIDFGDVFTYIVWARRLDSGSLQFVYAKKSQGDLFFTAADKFTFDNDVTSIVEESGTTTDQNWHMFALTRNGTGSGNTKLYKDGVDVTTVLSTTAACTTNAGIARIGDYVGASFPFNGVVDEVALFPTVLSASTIATLYAARLIPCADTVFVAPLMSEQPWIPTAQHWFAPDVEFAALQPPAVAPFDPANGFPWQEQPAAWSPIQWFAPDAGVLGDIPRVNAYSGFDLEEQPAAWTAQRWHQPEPEFAPLLPPAAAPFDPAGGFGWIEQAADWRPVQWYQPDAEIANGPATPPGPVFVVGDPPVAPLHTGFTWTDPVGGSSALSHIEWWHYKVLGASVAFDPTDPDWILVDTIAAGVQAYDDYWGELADYRGSGVQPTAQIAVNVEGLRGAPTLLNSGRTRYPPEYDWDPQQDRSTAERRFAPDASIEGLTPPAAPFDPATGFDWSEQPATWTQQHWFAPDPPSEATPPQSITVATVAEQAPLWTEQPYAPAPAWGTQPIDADPIQQPAAAPFDPATFPHSEQPGQERPNAAPWTLTADLLGIREAEEILTPWAGYDASQDRSIQPVWRHPDQEWHPTATGDGPSPFNVAALAGLWQDNSGQQDRSIQPVWRHPDDVVVPLITFPTTATVAEQAALWPEQPAAWQARLAMNAALLEPSSMTINPNLFAPPPGGAPAVLIDATTGDVYLYIGSNFIVPAS